MGTLTRKSYAVRRRTSRCRYVKLRKNCKKTAGCKWTKGKHRRYCRRSTYRRR